MSETRYIYIDFLKVVAFFAIVLLHTSAMGLAGGTMNLGKFSLCSIQ